MAPVDAAEETSPGDGSTTLGFEELVREMGPALWRLTAAYVHLEADREDLYQEILAAVWRALPHFERRSALRTYVLRIGHNRGLSYRARRERIVGLESEPVEDIPDPAPDPHEQLDRELQRHRLSAAIGRLSASLAQTVTLSLEGLSHLEIAQVLGITENNVGVRMTRARAALSRLLREEDGL